jgi:hypothetical protein
MRTTRATYFAWVRDELVLVGLLSAALLVFIATPGLRGPYDQPSLRLFLDTAIVLVSVIVAVLAYVRFTLDRQTFDLYLLCGFFVTAVATLAFAIVPALDGSAVGRPEAWALALSKVVAAALIAAAPFASGRITARADASSRWSRSACSCACSGRFAGPSGTASRRWSTTIRSRLCSPRRWRSRRCSA